jgi:hypothetical protein
MIAAIILMRVVAAEFPEERDDLRRFPLGENGELDCKLLASRRELVVMALCDQHHRRDEERERRDYKREERKREQIERGTPVLLQPDIDREPSRNRNGERDERAGAGEGSAPAGWQGLQTSAHLCGGVLHQLCWARPCQAG